jgi:hypothetical protein
VADRSTTFGARGEAGLLDQAHAATQEVIRRAGALADENGKRHLKVVSCHACDAPKACCSLVTSAFLHEGAVIARRLRRDGRDTPEMRSALRRAAEAMESSHATPYQAPCVFLGDGERCTVYADRPSECGVCFVYSPARDCSDPAVTQVERFNAGQVIGPVLSLAEEFRQAMGLPRLPGRLYVGVMPRMVLLALQAWDRDDYVKMLSRREWPRVPGA